MYKLYGKAIVKKDDNVYNHEIEDVAEDDDELSFQLSDFEDVIINLMSDANSISITITVDKVDQ